MSKGKTTGKRLCLPGLMLVALLLFIPSIAFSGEEMETLTGRLALIGNEPFTRLICRLEGNLKTKEPGAVQLEG